MKHSPSVSFVINTKNEEKNIAACIKSGKSLANEILVVDMRSTDKTVAIAKKLGARVISVPDAGFVEPARSVGITKAKGDWIFLIDADGRFTLSLRKTLKEIITTTTADVIRVPRKTIIFNRWIKHGNYWPDYQVRLFRKGFVEWLPIVHTQPLISSKARMLDLPAREDQAIIHHHGSTIQQLAEKMATQSQHERHYESLPRVEIKDMYNLIAGEFNARYFDHKGYKDGVAGFVAAKLREYYEFLEFAYYWERQGFPDMFNKHDLATTWKRQYNGTIQDDFVELEMATAFTRQQQTQIDNLQNELAIMRDSKFYALFQIYQKMKKVLGISKSS